MEGLVASRFRVGVNSMEVDLVNTAREVRDGVALRSSRRVAQVGEDEDVRPIAACEDVLPAASGQLVGRRVPDELVVASAPTAFSMTTPFAMVKPPENPLTQET